MAPRNRNTLLVVLALVGVSIALSRALADDASTDRGATTGGNPDSSERPERILPCNASAVDYLVSLVHPSRVLGLPHTAIAFATLDGPHAGWDELPLLKDYSSEAILSLNPDLVITHAWQDQAAMATVRSAGIAVIRLPETHNYAELRALLTTLGGELGAEDASRDLIADYDARVSALRGDHSRSDWTALSYSNYGTGGWTAGSRTTADFMIQLAGLTNAAATAGFAGHVSLDMEQLLEIDPDVLVLGVAASDYGSNPTLELLKNEPALASLSAVRAGRFAILPSHLALADSHRPRGRRRSARPGRERSSPSRARVTPPEAPVGPFARSGKAGGR